MPIHVNQLPPFKNKPTIIMPKTTSQTNGILVTNFENEMTLINNFDEIYNVEQQNELTIIIRKSNKTWNPPTRLKECVTYAFAFLIQIMEPTTLVEALFGLEAKQWCEALDDEFASLMKIKTWILVDLLANRSIVNSKWALKEKYNVAQAIEKYKM
jgi:hypothetical protein